MEVGVTGLEPVTPSVSTERKFQLIALQLQGFSTDMVLNLSLTSICKNLRKTAGFSLLY
jgi:hypothetical protein